MSCCKQFSADFFHKRGRENCLFAWYFCGGYTTTRENGELRQTVFRVRCCLRYTTTRENGELRQFPMLAPDTSRLYHYERKWGTTTGGAAEPADRGLYHYERKWGTMVFAPMPENDFPYIISPFSACVNPQTEGAGVAGCPGGLWHILDKRGNLG